jgi:hypothetical protein
VDEKLTKRQLLEKKMEALIAKRDDFVAAEQKKTAGNKSLDSFDRAVEETIKVQIN